MRNVGCCPDVMGHCRLGDGTMSKRGKTEETRKSDPGLTQIFDISNLHVHNKQQCWKAPWDLTGGRDNTPATRLIANGRSLPGRVSGVWGYTVPPIRVVSLLRSEEP